MKKKESTPPLGWRPEEGVGHLILFSSTIQMHTTDGLRYCSFSYVAALILYRDSSYEDFVYIFWSHHKIGLI